MKKCVITVCFIFIAVMAVAGCAGQSENTDKAPVDIDLTELSMTMIQAEYERIVSSPDENIGKTISVYGSLLTYIYDADYKLAHFVIIVQGDECCQMGFEFKIDGDYEFPDDYPQQNSMIKITGTLNIHEIFGTEYLYIAVDEYPF